MLVVSAAHIALQQRQSFDVSYLNLSLVQYFVIIMPSKSFSLCGSRVSVATRVSPRLCKQFSFVFVSVLPLLNSLY